jgi:hypothetical protein
MMFRPADAFERSCVAELLVQARAAADIGEQNGEIAGYVLHRLTQTVICPSIKEKPSENHEPQADLR